MNCTYCSRHLNSIDALKRHVASIHLNINKTCSVCNKRYSRTDALKRHTCVGSNNRCGICNLAFKGKRTLENHLRSHVRQNTDQKDDTPVQKHLKTIWRPWESQEKNEPQFLVEDPISPDPDFQSRDRISRLIFENWLLLRAHWHQSKKIQDRFLIRLPDYPTKINLKDILEEIHRLQKFKYKMNIAFGFVLRDTKTDQFTLYYPSNNNILLDTPVVISTAQDISKAVDLIDREDIAEYCRQHRPNTRFLVERVTNILVYVWKIKDYRIGCGPSLPLFLTTRRCIISLATDIHRSPYTDNLCLFRCIALHLGYTNAEMDRKARNLWLLWARRVNTPLTLPFAGVKLKEVPDIEHFFKINIDIFSLHQTTIRNRTVFAADKVYTSKRLYSNQTLNLNLHSSHFSYIKNLNSFANVWQCRKCDKLFSRASNCKIHERNCSKATHYQYSGGGYGLRKTVFNQLADHGIFVPETLQYFPYRVVFDFESMFHKNLLLNRKEVTAALEPISVSVASNVPGFEAPRFMVSTGDSQELVDRFLEHVINIADLGFQLVQNEHSDTLRDIDTLIEERRANNADVQDLVSVKARFQRWLRQMVVLGFNSGRFDLNLIRKYLFPSLFKHEEPVHNIIKRNNDYLSIETEKLLWLDIKNYLAPNTSYANWLKASGESIKKGIFPYEWLTSLACLDRTSLPDKKAYYSTLKQSEISDGDYKQLENLWISEGFRTMKDYLEWYNNLDVVPFVSASEKMFRHWVQLNIDPFKSGNISLPGLSLARLMNTIPKHTILPLFGPRHGYIHDLIRENIVGGLSVVIHRYHEKGLTKLPSNEDCKIIYSFDANSLYLYALAQLTGTGVFVLWIIETQGQTIPRNDIISGTKTEEDWKQMIDFNYNIVLKRQPAYTFYATELEWLEWVAHSQNLAIQHRFNGGQMCFKKSKKERYFVDGYDNISQTVFQFHGCNYHGHGCRMDRFRDNEARQKTSANTNYLRSLGLTVVEKWECEWVTEKKKNPLIRVFLRKNISLPNYIRSMKVSELIQNIKTGKFFGLVECDVEVPFWNKELMNYFAEFPPIIKNAMITRDDIGEYMKDFAEKEELMKQPRKSLINSFFAEKQLFGTPYLQWLLEKGLMITRVYLVVEQKPKNCFQHLSEEVAQHRREADLDPERSVTGETWKLIGNNYYGKTITDKRRHKNVKLVDENTATRLVNSQRFYKLEEISDDCCEVTMDKAKIKMDLPITVAFYVYTYAKVRMLQFVYDFLKYYLRPGSYQIVCSDTDSIVAAYASENIDDLVIAERRQEYFQHGKKRFLATSSYDKRTPGLFKVEWKGTGIIALCSKTYYTWDENGESKLSSKGLSKVSNRLTKEDYWSVLDSKIPGSGMNYGFRVFGNRLYQYAQKRTGLTYLYAKRKVLGDGVTTEPLDI